MKAILIASKGLTVCWDYISDFCDPIPEVTKFCCGYPLKCYEFATVAEVLTLATKKYENNDAKFCPRFSP
jgi:hypothetical protein